MALQKAVGLKQAVAVAGQEVVVGQAIYSANNYISDGTLKAGGFAFVGSASGNGVEFGTATASGSASAFLGFVERTQTGAITSETVALTDTYAAGENVTIAIRGQFYINAPADGTAGSKVFVSSSGATYLAASAAASGDTDTGFISIAPNGASSFSSGDAIIIEKF